VIRLAAPQDAAAIALIWNAVITGSAATFNSRPWPVDEIAALIAARQAEGQATFVAAQGQVTGFATYAQFRAGTGYARAMEHTIHLDPAAQGRGLGRALMAAIEDHAARAGARVMVAAVAGENTGGVAFHARLGYREVGRMPGVGHKFGRDMDLILMQKRLQRISPAAAPELR
jgi:L-amino acid N-acyltransferase